VAKRFACVSFGQGSFFLAANDGLICLIFADSLIVSVGKRNLNRIGDCRLTESAERNQSQEPDFFPETIVWFGDFARF
jgi:hypothetical protein